jgi:hypothetical protein
MGVLDHVLMYSDTNVGEMAQYRDLNIKYWLRSRDLNKGVLAQVQGSKNGSIDSGPGI